MNRKTLKNEGFRMELTQKARAEAVRDRMTAQVGGQWTWSDTLRYLIEQGLRYDASLSGAQRPGGTGSSTRFAGVVATVLTAVSMAVSFKPGSRARARSGWSSRPEWPRLHRRRGAA